MLPGFITSSHGIGMWVRVNDHVQIFFYIFRGLIRETTY